MNSNIEQPHRNKSDGFKGADYNLGFDEFDEGVASGRSQKINSTINQTMSRMNFSHVSRQSVPHSATTSHNLNKSVNSMSRSMYGSPKSLRNVPSSQHGNPLTGYSSKLSCHSMNRSNLSTSQYSSKS